MAQPKIIAHRGNSSAAPENTLAAVLSAALLDPAPRYIEIDIHRSEDGVIVVSHDDNTLKITGIDAMIRERTFEFLRTLDAGYKEKFGDLFPNERLPRLEEVLDAVKDLPIGIMIESKQLLLEDQVIELLRKRGEVEKHVFASFDELSVYRAKELEPKLKTLYLTGDASPTTIWRAKDLKADIMGVQFKGVEPQNVAAVQESGMQLWLWTVDEDPDINTWAEANVDGIITNYPAKALQLTK
jgi:glycerophosphoryl diester phosphodiesterase